MGGAKRRPGYDNDDAEFASLGDIPLASIRCPVLIIHGTADRSVPPAHAGHAHASITGSELRSIANGGHASYFFDTDAQWRALSWVAGHVAT